jgi:ABC-type Fe3+-hydroxamate transport system substrate-binding protein
VTHAQATDWMGTAHPRASDRPRIACLVPSLTETLFALGLGDSVVARTGFCVHPREARRVPKVGGTKDPDMRKLAALAPTHLVVNVDENRREDVDAARAFVPHVIVTHPTGPQDNARLLRLLGAVFAREAEAERIAHDIDAALAVLDAVGSALPRERVVYVVWKAPWMTVARDTYIAATLARAGWDTLPAHAASCYPELDDDASAWRTAARVLLSTEPYAFRERDAIALAQRLRKPVHIVDGEWTSWYGVRAREGLRALAAFRASLQR